MGDTVKRDEVANRLKDMIIKRLEIEDIDPASVSNDSPIFGEGLGLDSISALDLVILLEKEFKVKISEPSEAREIFASINTLADHVIAHGVISN